jgi:SNF2 family DNA or RNA helicase
MLLAQSAAAALGLNLQKGGNNICWYTLTYSLDTYLQANARLHRQGQEKPVFVYHILAEKTVDYAVLIIINKKDKQQTSLLAALGEYWK